MTLRLMMIFFIVVAVSCGSKKGKNDQYAPTSEDAASDQGQPQAKVHPGKSLYGQYCGSCHQTDGSGVPGMYPPLAETKYVNGDVEWLVESLVNGLEGPITVKGEEYNNLMPPMDYLSDKEIADILSYIRQSFGNDAEAVTEEQVKQIRASLKKGA